MLVCSLTHLSPTIFSQLSTTDHERAFSFQKETVCREEGYTRFNSGPLASLKAFHPKMDQNEWMEEHQMMCSCHKCPHVSEFTLLLRVPVCVCFSGNVNNHFIFSPSAGSNVSRLLLASPFDYEGGLDRIWEYRLLIFVTDDNLPTTNVQTGTVTLTIKIIPDPTTVVPTTVSLTGWTVGATWSWCGI